jgi:uncharacterized membrane protein
MWWRIFYGFLRLGLAFSLLHVVGTSFSDVLQALMEHEIIQEQNDFILQTLQPFCEHFSFQVTYFLIVYLVFWGVVDIVLSYNVLRHRVWAFPVSLYLIGVFVLYEAYRFTHTHSLVLLGVIGVDLVIMWMINKEYKKLKRR